MDTELARQNETMRQYLTEGKKRLLFAFPQVTMIFPEGTQGESLKRT
jgi:hypothetical protein